MTLSKIVVVLDDERKVEYDGIVNTRSSIASNNNKKGIINVLLEEHKDAKVIYYKGVRMWTK